MATKKPKNTKSSKNGKPSKATFNPVKNDPSTGRADRVIWSSDTLNQALDGLNQGYRLKTNPFYENNTKLLKADLLFERTPEELKRYKECMGDILEFVKECQLMTPLGIQHVTMRDYQENYLRHLQENRMSIYLSCRQAGKTTTSAIFMLWYILFNYDKNALVLGSKYSVAVEILDKVKNIFYYLPYYLKPGVRKWNESEIVLDNGCRILAEATTVNSGISYTFHCVLADEFAHVPKNILEKFYGQIYPTIIAGRARFMITSTQNGYNLFYKLFRSAEAGENDYAPFKVDWYQVPDWDPETQTWVPRTEEWHRREAANLGGEEAFQRQFGTSFDVSGNSLINNKHIAKARADAIEYKPIDIPGVEYSDRFIWHPDIVDVNELKSKHIIITIDLAEGIGQDSDIMCIHDVMWDDRLERSYVRCIGICDIKDIEVSRFAEIVIDFTSRYCHMDNTILSFESNTYGSLFYKSLLTYTDKHPDIYWDPGIIAKYESDLFSETKNTDSSGGSKISNKYILGFKVTSSSKKMSCKLFKYQYESGLIVNPSSKFIMQMENFSDHKGNGSYEATYGHDDIVMAEVQMAALTQTLKYRVLISSFEETVNTDTSTGFVGYGDYFGTPLSNPMMSGNIYSF